MRCARILLLVSLVLALTGCKRDVATPEPVDHAQVPMVRIMVETSPAGGEVSVTELDRAVVDGSIILEAGRYTLRASKSGYEPVEVVVEVDGVMPQAITIPLGTGVGSVNVAVNVDQASVLAGDEVLGSAPGPFELPEGTVRLAVRSEGYEETFHNVEIVAGETAELSVTLDPVPSSGPLDIKVSDSQSEVRLDGKVIGKGSVRVEDIAFGEHVVKASRSLAPHLRMHGESKIMLASPQGAEVTIAMHEQRRFDGNWLPSRDALQLEERRYRSLRVANPVSVRCSLDEAALAALREDSAFFESLHEIMRVGDTVALVGPSGEWLLWKRLDTACDDYTATVKAFAQSRQNPLPFAADKGAKDALIKGSAATLADIAFALHAARSSLPLLDLSEEQLGDSAVLTRSTQDGGLTLIAAGGESVAIDGQAATVMGDVAFMNLSAADTPLAVTWSKKPKRLLVATDAASPLNQVPAAGAELLIHEKLFVPFGSDLVTHIVRLSWLPEEKKWRTQEIGGTGPMGESLDLSTDEIGPHSKTGNYKRTWIVRYKDGRGETQRQVGTAYVVGDEVKQGRTDRFFRRNADATP